ncbi:DUF4177 domain-containing protein [Pseudopelagicola sp. nBUS_19]|uniref:DUF4177 domain-containing protein n=1 Tax=Pseudopelagicola sp. nBUS_19 TaxID=3395316 RepID=UPI003EBB147A
MNSYEYKIIPAPSKGRKGKNVKGPEGRFANALEQALNEMASAGWEFQRSETLPSEERSGLASSTTRFRSVLVFRRYINGASPLLRQVLDGPTLPELPAPVELPTSETDSGIALEHDTDKRILQSVTDDKVSENLEETDERSPTAT